MQCARLQPEVGEDLLDQRPPKDGRDELQLGREYVFTPTPGCDMPALFELIKESAALWRKHGAEVSLWSVQVGEIGNLAFAARFESTAKLGATLDALNNGPAFGAWRMKSIKSTRARCRCPPSR